MPPAPVRSELLGLWIERFVMSPSRLVHRTSAVLSTTNPVPPANVPWIKIVIDEFRGMSMFLEKVSVLPLNDRSDVPTVPTTPLIEMPPVDVTLAIEGDVIIAGMTSLNVTSNAVVSPVASPSS